MNLRELGKLFKGIGKTIRASLLSENAKRVPNASVVHQKTNP